MFAPSPTFHTSSIRLRIIVRYSIASCFAYSA